MEPTDKIKKIIANPETLATILLTLAVDRLGIECLSWDPETIRMEVEQSFGIPFPQENFNKLMAAIELVTSDIFYISLPDFIRLCNTLYNGTFDPRVFDPADATEVAWGITEALILWPPANPAKPFAEKILQYIQQAVQAEGIMVPPDILRLELVDAKQLWDQIQTSFSDDPAMFTAIYDIARDKTETINKLVKDKLRLLLAQLDSLELLHGNPRDAIKKMLAQLHIEQEEGQETHPLTIQD